MTPRVSVGIPVYNGGDFIAEAIRSIQAQTIEDIEIIISDNASTDDTRDICLNLAADDSRIRYLRNEANLGGPANTNRLVHEATAPLFKWAYADDVCGPRLLEDCIAALDALPGSVLACPRVRKIDEHGTILFDHEDADLGFDAPEPHVRLQRIYRTLGEQALFGVIRMDALRRTHLVQPRLADGFLLMTELCLMGPFPQTHSQEMLVRVHEGHFGATRKSQFRWIGATRRRDKVFAYTRSTGELLSIVRDSDLSKAEKARCRRVVYREWTLRNWRSSASDVKNLLSDLRAA
jgi:glycosyltransferase involved in cell wall biosynthesis